MPHPRVNVLLVDDRPENLLALRAIFDDAPYRLVMAESGEEALKHVLREDFAVILLDVQMPGMDGYETARLIKQRARSRDIPIIFVTALQPEDAYVFRGYAVGAVDYLFKPIDPTILKAKVAAFAALHQQALVLAAQTHALRE